MSSSSDVRLNVTPSQCLYNCPFKLIASGLQPGQPYTIVARSRFDDADPGYQCHAHFVADDCGVIDLDTAASQGGCYKGVDRMALAIRMQSLSQDRDEAKRSFHQRRYENPLKSIKISFTLHSGHIEPSTLPMFLINQQTPHIEALANQQQQQQQSPLATASVKRLIKSKDVNRFEVRRGRVRGILFLPKTDTVLPGIIDIAGIPYPGEVYDMSASMLAAQGYVTLALAYCNFDDLPKGINLDLEYFIEAVEWLHSLPQVKKGGIIVHSSCVGSIIAMHLAVHSPLVRAVIAINSGSYIFDGTMTYAGNNLDVNMRSERTIVNGVSHHRLPPKEELVIPIEKSHSSIPFLFIVGEEDSLTPPEHTTLLVSRLEKAGRGDKVKVVRYPGVGHVIKPPFTPAKATVSPKGPGLLVYFGGDPEAYYKYSEAIWKEIIAFIAQSTLVNKL